MEFRIWLEVIRATAVLIVLVILIKKEKSLVAIKRRGYMLIMIGYALLVFASLLDITDDFPSLNKYVIIGDTPIQAILEKVVGYLLGFLLIAIGFWRWLPGVSELQQTQDKLQKSLSREREMLDEKLKHQKLESIGILAGGIAHDFNNLLMGIQGNINLAILLGKFDGELLEILTDADKATKRAAMLTQQLLTFSKGGAPNIRIASVDEIVQESATFALSGSDIKSRFNIDKNLWLTGIDKGQIGQVIQNIVINARQAMTKGGKIDIAIKNIHPDEAEKINLSDKKYVNIKIEDTGIGITKENLTKIFDPYFSTKDRGSGLGLATSFSIVKKHHGHIKVDSKEGKGSVFSIYIPAVEKKKEKPPLITSDDQSKKRSLTNGKVLIMDDDPIIRKLLSSMLKKLGYNVIQASDGKEALSLYEKAMADKDEIDIVMLDLTIPGGVGGEETAKQLQKINKNVKMMVVSGYGDSPVLSDFKKYGFAASLTKPFKMDNLNKALQEIRK